MNFLRDLAKHGCLAPLCERVRIDHTVALELRGRSVIFYYRGAKLLEISSTADGYSASYDESYVPAGSQSPLAAKLIRTEQESTEVLRAWPLLKEQIDLWLGRRPKEEREIQQSLVRDNNWGAVARSTDYFICDIEYAFPGGRFDFVAVNWPSDPSIRRRSGGHRLVVGEVKHGDDALVGKAGLHEHVRAANQFLGDQQRLAEFKQEMCEVFNQKRQLELISVGKDLSGFGSEPPLILLAIANHDPDKSNFSGLVDTLPACPNAEVRFASSSLFGYGLYDKAILTHSQTVSLLGGWHKAARPEIA